MIRRLCHLILAFYYSKGERKFQKSLSALERVQREKLKKILFSLQDTQQWGAFSPHLTFEELVQKIPVRQYSDYRSTVERQRTCQEDILSKSVVRYEPTSGSTEACKWIPYSSGFLEELNSAARVWMGDVYHRFPGVKKGLHYWSLSWLPEDLRGLTSSNDADLFPSFQKWFLKQTMAVPAEIALVKNPEAAWWATLMFLAAQKDLALVSVWSPTFWLKVTEDLRKNWSDISMALTAGCWGRFEIELNQEIGVAPQRDLTIDFPDLNKLWPKLALISSWDSASSTPWANKIKSEFPNAEFQGKGLWATEGVVTIPYQQKKCLAFQTHFFEFKDLETGQTYPSWDLKIGREYQPILWTSTGLLRLSLQDRVLVTGFLESVPCFEFISRIQSTDLVGEKIDASWVQKLFESYPQWKAIALVAVRDPQPHYYLCGEAVDGVDIEAHLCQLHHYRVARELGQLAQAQVTKIDDVFTFWGKFGKSGLLGQNKPEVLIATELFQSV